jgi:hypothetical protein
MAVVATGLSYIFVIPAEAGIHGLICNGNAWIPVFTPAR